MKYSLQQNHALLTSKVKGLLPEQFAVQVDTAESLLRLDVRPTVTRANDLRKVELALAHQMNFQVELGLDPLIQEDASSSHTRQSVGYRDRWINPMALAILEGIGALGSAYSGIMRSVRTEGGHVPTGTAYRLSDYRD